jgi:hypothetical protein
MADRVQTTIRFPKDFHKKLKHAATERELDIAELVMQSLEVFLGGPEAPRSSRTDQAAAPEPSEWHRKLTEILASGDQPTIAAVTQNIDVFHDRLRPARRRRAV